MTNPRFAKNQEIVKINTYRGVITFSTVTVRTCGSKQLKVTKSLTAYPSTSPMFWATIEEAEKEVETNVYYSNFN